LGPNRTSQIGSQPKCGRQRTICTTNQTLYNKLSLSLIVIVIVSTNQDSTSSRLLPGSSYSCCIRNLHALVRAPGKRSGLLTLEGRIHDLGQNRHRAIAVVTHFMNLCALKEVLARGKGPNTSPHQHTHGNYPLSIFCYFHQVAVLS
jgi:hypothetical protein